MLKKVVHNLQNLTLQGQKEALKLALKERGLKYSKKNLRRIVRVKQIAPWEEEGERYPVITVQGAFVLDKGKDTEQVLFYFREPTLKDPKLLVWYPSDSVTDKA